MCLSGESLIIENYFNKNDLEKKFTAIHGDDTIKIACQPTASLYSSPTYTLYYPYFCEKPFYTKHIEGWKINLNDIFSIELDQFELYFSPKDLISPVTTSGYIETKIETSIPKTVLQNIKPKYFLCFEIYFPLPKSVYKYFDTFNLILKEIGGNNIQEISKYFEMDIYSYCGVEPNSNNNKVLVDILKDDRLPGLIKIYVIYMFSELKLSEEEIEEVLPIILTRLKNTKAKCFIHAIVFVLANIGKPAQEAIPYLREILTTENHTDIREITNLALSKIDDFGILKGSPELLVKTQKIDIIGHTSNPKFFRGEKDVGYRPIFSCLFCHKAILLLSRGNKCRTRILSGIFQLPCMRRAFKQDP